MAEETGKKEINIPSLYDLPDRKIYVCAVCGNTVYDEAPAKCPVCNTSSDRFSEIV